MRIVWCATHHRQMLARKLFCSHKRATIDGCKIEERVVLRVKADADE